MPGKEKQVLSAVIFIYFLCFIFRFMEYFLLRTDETFWGEAFLHKLIGMAILFLAGKHYGFRFAEIGFTPNKIWLRVLQGLAFGLFVFVPAYFLEFLEDYFKKYWKRNIPLPQLIYGNGTSLPKQCDCQYSPRCDKYRHRSVYGRKDRDCPDRIICSDMDLVCLAQHREHQTGNSISRNI